MIRARLFSTVLLLAAAFAAPLRAGWQRVLETDSDSGISVEFISPFETMPRDGFVPVRMKIKNGSGVACQWTLQSSSGSGYYQNRSTMTSEIPLAVGAGETGVFNMVLPLAPAQSSSSYGQMLLQLTGPGSGVRGVSVPVDGRGADGTGFVGMSEKLTARSWKPLKDYLDKKKTPLSGSEVDLTLLSDDWRGLLGLRSFWLTDNEYVALSPQQRLAIRDWILQGGELFLCSQDPATAPRADFGVEGAAASASFGLGHVHFVPWNGVELNEAEVAGHLWALGSGWRQGMESGYGSNWQLARKVGAITWNIPMLSVGILLFALVVGPLNLFWFARSGQRHRLFWTTPLISVTASLILGALIVIQEGFGGVGSRAMLVYLDAAGKRSLTMQEQLSKTGVVADSRFDAPDIGLLTPLPISGFGQQRRDTTCEQEGGKYSGDWFATRWRQGQFAESIRASRADMRLLVDASGPPRVLSSIPVTLREVYVVDAEGRCWTAQDVPVGRKVDLRPAESRKLAASLDGFPAGTRLRDSMAALRGRKNFFYAFADSGEFLPTLASIRWHSDTALYAGPLAATTTGAAP